MSAQLNLRLLAAAMLNGFQNGAVFLIGGINTRWLGEIQAANDAQTFGQVMMNACLLYTSPSPRD